MNGMAASDRLFKILDLPEPEQPEGEIDPENCDISLKDVSFSYDEDREVLHSVSFDIKKGRLTSVCGESGSGKSTVSAILMGRNKGYKGSVTIGGKELKSISEKSLMQTLTYISHNAYLFGGTVRDNLLMGNFSVTDDEMNEALRKTKLYDFLESEQGLDTVLSENASNLSGGQRQRLALARALLHDTPIYIFDEATSAVDSDSEADIISLIYDLAKTKTVILITHRLANCKDADNICVLENGRLAGQGTHDELMNAGGSYADMWATQQALESIGKGEE